MVMGPRIKIDPKAIKKLEAEVQRKLDTAAKKHPIPADATRAEQKRAAEKLMKAASKLK